MIATIGNENIMYGVQPYSLIGGVPTEALRHPLLCIDPFTGRADEDELFPTHSKF